MKKIAAVLFSTLAFSAFALANEAKPLSGNDVRKAYEHCLTQAVKPIIGSCIGYTDGHIDADSFEMDGSFSFNVSCLKGSDESEPTVTLHIFQGTKDAVFRLNGTGFYGVGALRLLGGLPKVKYEDLHIAYYDRGEDKGKVDWKKSIVSGARVAQKQNESSVALIWDDAHRQASKYSFDVANLSACLDKKLAHK